MIHITNFADIQNLYVELYKQFRKYILDYDVVCALADLEVEIYHTCQDVDLITTKLDILYRLAKNLHLDDEELDEAFDDLYDLLENTESTYADLHVNREVVQNNDYTEIQTRL